MGNKKLNNDVIKEAILQVFGSIDEYARYRKTSPQNIYERIRNQSHKFLHELERDGIKIKKINSSDILIKEKQRVGDTLNYSNSDKYIQILEKLNAEYESKIAHLEIRIKELQDELKRCLKGGQENG